MFRFKINYKHTLKLIKQLDWKIMVIVLLIIGCGILIISSAVHVNAGGNPIKIYKQIFAVIMGIILIIIILFFDYNFIGKYYKAIYLISLLILLMALLPGVGKSVRGAYRWVKLGPMAFQPSEIAKFTFVLCYAKIIESKKGKLKTLKELVSAVIYAVPFFGLVLIEPDLGTALVFFCITIAMLFVAGMNMKYIIRGIIVLVIISPMLYFMMADHQKTRIEAFLNPEDVTLKGNYQVMQSLIAIGSGGVTGKGLYHGTQNQEDFLPINDSDFIFGVVGEELGAIGMAVFIILFILLLYRLIFIAGKAKDFYGTLIVIGVLGMIFYQVVENMSMTVVLLPVTGITLPFVSAGASSILSALANIGLVLNVYMRRKKINF